MRLCVWGMRRALWVGFVSINRRDEVFCYLAWAFPSLPLRGNAEAFEAFGRAFFAFGRDLCNGNTRSALACSLSPCGDCSLPEGVLENLQEHLSMQGVIPQGLKHARVTVDGRYPGEQFGSTSRENGTMLAAAGGGRNAHRERGAARRPSGAAQARTCGIPAYGNDREVITYISSDRFGLGTPSRILIIFQRSSLPPRRRTAADGN